MPQPTRAQVHIDAILTNISIAYRQAQTAFVASRVFPVIPVDKPSNRYFVFDQNNWFLDAMERRPPATESAGSGYTLSTDNYSCDVYALHKDIPDQIRESADLPLNPDRNATQWLTQMALMKLEIQWQTDYFATGVWATDATISNKWDTFASSDPILDIRTGIRTILANTGFMANSLVLGFDVWNKLQDHPDITDRMKITDDKITTPALLARILNIDNVYICQGIKSTTREGAATPAYDFIMGKHALLCYAAPAPALEMPSAGYTFMWTGISGGLGADVGVSSFRLDHLRVDRVEIEAAWDNKVVSRPLGYFMPNAVT